MIGCRTFSGLVDKIRHSTALTSVTKSRAFGIVYLGYVAAIAAEVEPISVNQSGTDMGNDEARPTGFSPAISRDGRFVVFTSRATDLTPVMDRNGTYDVFVRDRWLGGTELISIDTSGTHSGDGFSVNPTMSDDGRFVAFRSAASNLVGTDTNAADDVFLRDRARG